VKSRRNYGKSMECGTMVFSRGSFLGGIAADIMGMVFLIIWGSAESWQNLQYRRDIAM